MVYCIWWKRLLWNFSNWDAAAKHSVILWFLLFGVYKPRILLTTLKTSGQQIVTERKKILMSAFVTACMFLWDFIGGSRCINVCEAHLVRDGQQHSVQLLHQLFEGRSLGGNGMPALTHHHVAKEKKKAQKIISTIWKIVRETDISFATDVAFVRLV